MFRKGPAFEGSSHIPFIFSLPGRNPQKPAVLDTPVSLIDLLPTFLDYAGITPKEKSDGVSLRPLLEGTVDQQDWERKYIYGENYRDMKAFGIQVGWDFVVSSQYKYVWNSTTGEEYFFDLLHDPNELHDLSQCGTETELAEMTRMRNYLIEQFKDRPGDGLLNEDGSLHVPSLLPSYRPPEWAALSREEVLKKPKPNGGFPMF